MQEPKQFNDFLRYLYKFSQERNQTSFCKFLASKEVTLISKTDAVDRYISAFLVLFLSVFLLLFKFQSFNCVSMCFLSSEVTDDEARSFLIKSEPMLN